MLKLCIGLVCLRAVLANGLVQQNAVSQFTNNLIRDMDTKPNNKPYDEIPCLSTGGTCVMFDSCPKDKLSKPLGLCPLQQTQGVECCYHLRRKFESKCSVQGGACMSLETMCPVMEASNCAIDEKCCLLLK